MDDGPCEMNIVKSQLQVRWMIRRDMPSVLSIESESFDSPWNEEKIISYLRQRECIGVVVEHDSQVVGFMIYMFIQQRIHVARIGVHPDFRMQGVGATMLDKLKSKLTQDRRSRITADVIETNLPMHKFLRSEGFRATGATRKMFAEETGDLDGYSFEFRVIGHD
jgi:[ribosomal protein S18]-alanine N-acetyltransferase